MKKENKMSDDFKDIEKENNVKTYVIVCILYIIVIVLTVLLVIGIKNQKRIILDNSNSNNALNNSVNEDVGIPEINHDIEINRDDTVKDEEINDGDNIIEEPPALETPENGLETDIFNYLN